MEVTPILRLRVPLPDLAQMVGGTYREQLEDSHHTWVFESANIYNSFMEEVDSYVEIVLKEIQNV